MKLFMYCEIVNPYVWFNQTAFYEVLALQIKI
jgi:hypothetical protein